MSDVIHHKDKLRHPFTFHGEGASYFIICPVNLFLSVITLGFTHHGQWFVVAVIFMKIQSCMGSGLIITQRVVR